MDKYLNNNKIYILLYIYLNTISQQQNQDF